MQLIWLIYLANLLFRSFLHPFFVVFTTSVKAIQRILWTFTSVYDFGYFSIALDADSEYRLIGPWSSCIDSILVTTFN